MQKVISINLNGNAYQLDEAGYDALQQYLASAERALAGNPDRTEILADLEQAIADKCQAVLGPHKSIVSTADVERIVKEMGPIDPAPGDATTADGEAAPGAAPPRADPRPRRLYRIPSGAMIAGVCNGLAAYIGVDVTLVRVGFVVAAALTKGAAILGYVAMMFIVPEARTAEEQAVAGGLPFNAQDVIERAKDRYAEGARHWRKHWRQQQRHWRRYGPAAVAFPYGPTPALIVLLPFLALVHLALLVTMMAMVISLVNTGAIFTWHLPEGVPLWAGVVILLTTYQVVVSPIRAANRWSLHSQAGGPAQWFAFWNAVVWMAGLAAVVWLASNHVVDIREFLQRSPEVVRDFAQAIRDAVAR